MGLAIVLVMGCDELKPSACSLHAYRVFIRLLVRYEATCEATRFRVLLNVIFEIFGVIASDHSLEDPIHVS